LIPKLIAFTSRLLRTRTVLGLPARTALPSASRAFLMRRYAFGDFFSILPSLAAKSFLNA
jgi:hypothetical protein